MARQFVACRIVGLLNELDEDVEEIDIEDIAGLLDNKFDPKLTVEVLSKEIEPEEKYGLPDLFEGLQKLDVF